MSAPKVGGGLEAGSIIGGAKFQEIYNRISCFHISVWSLVLKLFSGKLILNYIYFKSVGLQSGHMVNAS